MKTPKKDLFQLIHSLSPAQKCYFKRHFAPAKGNLTILFDHLNGLEVYDEKLLKLDLNNSKIAKNLKVYKVQLTKLILKSLVAHHASIDDHSRLILGIREVELLKDKELFCMANVKLKKLKKLMNENAAFEFSPILFKLEEDFKMSLDSFQEAEYNLSQLKFLTKLKKLRFKMIRFILGNEETKLTEAEVSYLNKLDFNNALFDPLSSIYLRWTLTYFEVIVKRNPIAAKKMIVNILEVLDDTDVVGNLDPIDFREILFIAGLFSYNMKDDELLDLVQSKVHGKDTSIFMHESNARMLYLQVLKYLRKGDYQYIIDKIEPTAERILEKMQSDHLYLRAELYVQFFLCHLIQKNTVGQSENLQKMYALVKQLSPLYYQIFEFLELVSFYEANDVYSLTNRISSLLRKKSLKEFSPHFILVLNLIQDLLKTKESEKRALVEKFKEDCAALPWDTFCCFVQRIMMDDWLEALMTNNSLSDKMTA